jgi:monoamine oxidase
MILDIAIIGGGLSGLSLAQGLMSRGRQPTVFEARDRLGGRILSRPAGADFRFDLGPSWIWPEFQPRLADFIEQHNLELYPQWTQGHSLFLADRGGQPQAYVDHATYESARRIRGGTYRLVDVLLREIPLQHLILNHRLREVRDLDDHVELRFDGPIKPVSVKARQVVITIPPRLLANTVMFHPALDGKLHEVMTHTATWMAGHAKAAIRYARPFWREAGLSGGALSSYQGAALGEVFDASSVNGEYAALSGFFALPAMLRSRYHEDLEALILEQLVYLFGKEAARPEEILIKDWFGESYTATEEDQIPPDAHPQYGHAWLQLDHWNDKLYFSGTETASEFGGYLEGALESTARVMKALSM